MAAGAGLSGAVGVLFRIVLRLQDKQIDTSEKLGRYKGEQEGMLAVHKDVLNEVRNALKNGGEKNE